MWVAPGSAMHAPKRTCPSCLSAVSNWVTTCPYCRTALPPVAAPPSPVATIRHSAPVTTPAVTPRRNSTLKALIFGYLALVFGGVAGVLILMLRQFIKLVERGVSQDEAYTILMADPGLMNRMWVFSLLITIVAGLVAGRAGRERELYHGGMIGLVSLFSGSVTAMANPNALPAWRMAIGAVVTLPLALFGGYLARMWRERREDADPAAMVTVDQPPSPVPAEARVEVVGLWIDRWGRYLYVPLLHRLGSYLVPAARAAEFDREVYRFTSIASVCGAIFASPYALEPRVRVLRITAALTFIVFGRLWKTRDLIPVTVAGSDIVKRYSGRTAKVRQMGRTKLVVYLVLCVLCIPLCVLYASRVSAIAGGVGVLVMVAGALLSIDGLRRLRQ
jgi:hypothetical protein